MFLVSLLNSVLNKLANISLYALSAIGKESHNKKCLDCDQSNYSSRIIFSYTFTLEPNTNSSMAHFGDMAIQNYTRWLTAAILDLVQPEVKTFDPPTRKPYTGNKREEDRMIRCRATAVRNVPRCEVGRQYKAVVGF